MKALAAATLAACASPGATLDVALAVAPGSHLLDDVQTLRLVITNPHRVTTATRDNGRFSVSIIVEATGASTSMIVDGLDAAGTVIATGASPAFPLGTVDTHVTIYMSAPNAIAAAPVQLAAARDQLGVAALSYGAIIAGGRARDGAPSDAVAIYNVFDHSLATGVVMPGPRTGIAVAGEGARYVYFVGGRDASGMPTGTVWRFDTDAAPNGAVDDWGDRGFARAGQTALPIGDGHFLISGTPAVDLSASDATVTARPDIAALPPSSAAVTGGDGGAVAIFVDGNAVTRFRNNAFDAVDAPAAKRDGANVVGLPGGKVAIVCGDGDAVRLDPVTGQSEIFAAVPSSRRTGCAVAATSRHIVIAGGTAIATGSIATTAEIYDATTLAPVATVPLVVPRTGAQAIALPNDQILISSGLDATSAPTAVLELFTPLSRE